MQVKIFPKEHGQYCKIHLVKQQSLEASFGLDFTPIINTIQANMGVYILATAAKHLIFHLCFEI
jgi:hypothetical protein